MGEKFKVEIVEDIVAQGRQDADALPARRLGRLLPRARTARRPGAIGVIKLLSVAGAYWRGDHRNAHAPAHLRHRVLRQEGARRVAARSRRRREKRDHRKLGKELDLFHFHPVAPGAAFWTPQGHRALHDAADCDAPAAPRRTATWRSRRRCSSTRRCGRRAATGASTSENMFLVLDTRRPSCRGRAHDFSLKPMNCPSHHLFYGMKKHSYRELPLRLHTQDVLHRNEATGVARRAHPRAPVRSRTTRTSTAWRSQIADEVAALRRSCSTSVYNAFGLEFTREVRDAPRAADRRRRAVGPRRGARSRRALEQTRPAVRAQARRRRVLRPEDRLRRRPTASAASGSSARSSSTTTRPSASTSTYIGEDNKRAPAGRASTARSTAASSASSRILIEHFAGTFPVWLAPVQARILTGRRAPPRVGRRGRGADARARASASTSIARTASSARRSATRSSRRSRTRWSIGDKEVEAGGVSPRKHGTGKEADLGLIKLQDFLEQLKREAAIPY